MPGSGRAAGKVAGTAKFCLDFEDRADGISSGAACGCERVVKEGARAEHLETHTRGLSWAGYP